MDDFERTLRGPWRDHGRIALPARHRLGGDRSRKPTYPELSYLRPRISYSELFARKPTWDDLFNRLRGLGLRSVMASLSFLNSVLHVKGVLNAQDDTVSGTFDADLI